MSYRKIQCNSSRCGSKALTSWTASTHLHWSDVTGRVLIWEFPKISGPIQTIQGSKLTSKWSGAAFKTIVLCTVLCTDFLVSFGGWLLWASQASSLETDEASSIGKPHLALRSKAHQKEKRKARTKNILYLCLGCPRLGRPTCITDFDHKHC